MGPIRSQTSSKRGNVEVPEETQIGGSVSIKHSRAEGTELRIEDQDESQDNTPSTKSFEIPIKPMITSADEHKPKNIPKLENYVKSGESNRSSQFSKDNKLTSETVSDGSSTGDELDVNTLKDISLDDKKFKDNKDIVGEGDAEDPDALKKKKQNKKKSQSDDIDDLED